MERLLEQIGVDQKKLDELSGKFNLKDGFDSLKGFRLWRAKILKRQKLLWVRINNYNEKAL